MTINTVFFKEQENRIGPNGIDYGWSGPGSHAAPAYGESNAAQSKVSFLDLSAGANQFRTAAKEHNEQGLGKENNTTHFTLFSVSPEIFKRKVQGLSTKENLKKGRAQAANNWSILNFQFGDCNDAESISKTQMQNVVSQVQAATVEYRGHIEFGFGQPLICAKYPYSEQCYGVYSPYGAQIADRIMLPLSMTVDGGPIFVNAKQYKGIMRRRKKRALEMEKKVLKARKPYIHLSRHLHAKRRARGSGGRFLNTKNSNSYNDMTNSKKDVRNEEKQHPQSTESQISEVLQSEMGTYTKGTTSSSSRSTSPGSEVSSHPFSRATSLLHPSFEMIDHHVHPSFQLFSINGADTGLGIGMASGNYLKV